MLGRIASWLRSGGLLLVTLAETSHAGYIEDDFHGASMYWSHFAAQDYDPMFERAGFTVVRKDRVDHGYAGTDRDPESHPLVLARRK